MDKRIVAGSAAAGVVVVAVGIFVAGSLKKDVPALPPEPQAAADLPVEADFPARLRAAYVVDIAPPQAGQIAAFFVDVNEDVTEGQLLARVSAAGIDAENEAQQRTLEAIQTRVNTIESGIITARLEASRARADASRARAEFDRAEKAHRRQQMLYGEGATPKNAMEKAGREYELAKGEFDALEDVARRADERIAQLLKDLDSQKRLLEDKQAEAEQLQERMQASEIYAPVTGMIVGRSGEIGETVAPDRSDFFRIATQLNELEAELTPDPATLLRVKAGQDALVIVAAAGEGLPGKVMSVQGTTVVVRFANPNPAIRPGGSAQVKIRLE